MKKIHFPIPKISESGARFMIYCRSGIALLPIIKTCALKLFQLSPERTGTMVLQSGLFVGITQKLHMRLDSYFHTMWSLTMVRQSLKIVWIWAKI